ncbi:MAG TPA: M3 family metallopeptidase [Thermoplasmata archaeon]|nr:M3 family metallopeptidase [Thermoplasmata archaeon]
MSAASPPPSPRPSGASTGERTATLGSLPFTLTAESLAREGARLLAEARTEVAARVAAPGPWTVENFLAPLDALLVRARDLSNHAGLLFQVHPDGAVRDAARATSEAADRFFNELRVDDRLYRILTALEVPSDDPETRYAVDKMLREMRRAGAEQPPDQRARLIELTNRIDRISNDFTGNIAKGERAVAVPRDRLTGLPPDYLAAHVPGADGAVRITTKYPDAHPVMAYCDDPEVRRELLFEMLNVAHPENLPVLEQLLVERRALARLLRYRDYAEFATEDKMMETPEAVAAFLDRIADLLTPAARQDLARFLARKRRDDPTAERLDPWDAAFWSDGYFDTKIRQEEYGVDLRALRSYLPYPAVRDGLFRLCEELFGLAFRRRTDEPLWHPTVEAYDVARHGRPVGRCFFDLVPRAGKYTHAAQFDLRTGTARGDLPQAVLVCNFLDPGTPPETARMEYRDVVTFFHEFGHLLHNLLSGDGPWLYTTMPFVEWDFVEAPSQLFEEWARDPTTLARFARDPTTGAPIPPDLLARLAAAEAMGRALRQLRQVALATISLDLYRRDPTGLDTTAAFREGWDRRCPSSLDRAYHPQTAWGHLTGYSACYYTYVWSNVIARDLLTPFRQSGSLTDRATAERYAAEILAPGSRRPAAELVRRFLGREFDYAAYERWALEGAEPTRRPDRPAPLAR